MNHIIAAILADEGISQAFQAGVALGEPDQEGLPVRRALYVGALLRFDHQFEMSEDQRIWSAGRIELERLRAERAVVDADGRLWRTHMHESYRHG